MKWPECLLVLSKDIILLLNYVIINSVTPS
jgi:hypothetical protein